MAKPTTAKTPKNTQKCTQDIRSIPPARYALPTDGRKKNQLSRERQMLLIQMSTYANGDGTDILVSIPTLAKPMGSTDRTVQRLMKDLRTLGFVTEGGLDPHFHTRVRSINIGKVVGVTDSTETGVTDSTEKGDRLEGRGDRYAQGRVTDSRVGVTNSTVGVTYTQDRSALPSINRPPTVHFDRPLTGAAPASGLEVCRVVEFVGSSGSNPTTKSTTQDPSGNPTSIPNMRAGSPVGVKASVLAKSVIIKAAPDYSDPFIATDRAKAIRAAREADHIFCVGEACSCCRIKLAQPHRPFCRECDNECEGKCQMQDIFLALHQNGGDWRDSVFAPFNEKRLVEVAGKVIAHAVRVALNSSPNNAATNLDRVLQLTQCRIEAMSRLKPTAGVVAMLEDLYTMVLWITRHCENVRAAVTVLDNSPRGRNGVL